MWWRRWASQGRWASSSSSPARRTPRTRTRNWNRWSFRSFRSRLQKNYKVKKICRCLPSCRRYYIIRGRWFMAKSLWQREKEAESIFCVSCKIKIKCLCRLWKTSSDFPWWVASGRGSLGHSLLHNKQASRTRTRGMSEGMGNGEYITTRVSKPDPGPVGSGVLPGSGSGFQISLDLDPVFKFL